MSSKGYGRQLLVAVARDLNDQNFLLAIVMVKFKNKDFWSWFMDILIDDKGRKS